jgi:beta-glucanase (GH16 family)
MFARQRLVLWFLFICLLALLYEIVKERLNHYESQWVLAWSDEFDGTTVDHSKWNVLDTAAPRNNELEYYTPEAVSVKDGYLRIRTDKRSYKGMDYTSGALHTRFKYDFLYGKVEIHARLPKGQGIWPAHWMPPSDHASPYEIDIMEMLGHEPNKIYLTHHWLGWIPQQYTGTYVGPDYSKAFHTFTVEWEPGKITWYIDGVERFSSTSHVQETPAYLYVNTAVGGNWPGSPDETTVFPQFHDIDYVRVYQKQKVDWKFWQSYNSLRMFFI